MPKFKMTHASQPAVYTKRYSAFRGVDFSMDASQVDDSRSPMAVNIVADAGGCPQKRLGWRCLAEVEAPVRGIYRFETVVKNEEGENRSRINDYVIHAGAKIYRWSDGESKPIQIMDGLTGESSKGFMYDDKLYILTGEEFIFIKATLDNKETVPVVSAGNVNSGDKEVAYIPLTRYEMEAEATASSAISVKAGITYEEANIATPYRRNKIKLSYRNDSDYAIVIKLDENVAANASVGEIKLETEEGNVLKGGTKVSGYGSACMLYGKISATGYNWEGTTTASGENPYLYIDCRQFVEWLESKGEEIPPDTIKEINVTVTYPAATPIVELADGDKEEYPDYFDRIRKCRTFSWYNSRLFVTGNPDYPNADWYSQVGDPTFFKEIDYTEIGNDDSAILGYLPAGEQQAVIKSDSMQLQDASVYLRRAEWDDENGYYFPVKKGITGTGAVSFNGFETLVDDGMYLSKSGVMGVICENITGERVLHSRSTLVNNRLLKEANLENAVCCVWNGYFLIAVNGNVYVADSRQKTYARNASGNFEYEWYFWDNIPAACFKEHNGALYFGTADGKVCKFNTDLYDADGSISSDTYSDWPDGLEGEPTGIRAEWATRFDDDGDFMIKKNMTRRGCGVFLKGTHKGKIRVTIRTDNEYMRDLAERANGVYDTGKSEFYDVEPSHLPPGPVAVNKKVKKYSVIQIICSSSNPGEEFGVLGIERRFVKTRFIK